MAPLPKRIPAGLALVADERPAGSEKDLAGKKICWDDGKWAVFGAESSPTDRHGHWVVSERGTVTFGNVFQYLILPDGSLSTGFG